MSVAVIAGVGPGLGESLVRRLTAGGYEVGMLARSGDYLAELEEELRQQDHSVLGVPTDISDREQVSAAFLRVREELGPVAVLVNHASSAAWKGLLELSPEEFERAWRVAAWGAFLCSREAVADMLELGGGTVIFTGATSAVRGRGGALAFSAAKFAVRGMAESMARELGPEGIHVAHVVIDGQIDTPALRRAQPDRDPETLLDPDAIAESYWHLIQQDRSAWTLELDVRPHVESF